MKKYSSLCLILLLPLIQISLFGCAGTNTDDLVREKRIAESPQWNGEIFQNPERVPATEWGTVTDLFDVLNLFDMWNTSGTVTGLFGFLNIVEKPGAFSKT